MELRHPNVRLITSRSQISSENPHVNDLIRVRDLKAIRGPARSIVIVSLKRFDQSPSPSPQSEWTHDLSCLKPNQPRRASSQSLRDGISSTAPASLWCSPSASGRSAACKQISSQRLRPTLGQLRTVDHLSARARARCMHLPCGA